MFRSLFLLMTTILLASCGAAVSEKLADNAPRTIHQDLEFPDRSADELFENLSQWLPNYYNNLESTIDFSDKESGKIIGRYVFQFKTGQNYYNGLSTINIEVEDHTVKFLFSKPQVDFRGNDMTAFSSGFTGDYSVYSVINDNNYHPISRLGFMEIFIDEWKKMLDSATAFINSGGDMNSISDNKSFRD